MIIEVREVPPFSKNGFVVGCESTGEAVVIDPGDEVDQLLEIVKRDRAFRNDAARTRMLDVFEMAAADEPLVLEYRTLLSSLLF